MISSRFLFFKLEGNVTDVGRELVAGLTGGPPEDEAPSGAALLSLVGFVASAAGLLISANFVLASAGLAASVPVAEGAAAPNVKRGDGFASVLGASVPGPAAAVEGGAAAPNENPPPPVLEEDGWVEVKGGVEAAGFGAVAEEDGAPKLNVGAAAVD